jgi:hypothetical protein
MIYNDIIMVICSGIHFHPPDFRAKIPRPRTKVPIFTIFSQGSENMAGLTAASKDNNT